MTQTARTIGPIILIILDGWGYQTNTEYNAIHLANTPCWDNLWRNYPHGLLSSSGHCVGLPEGQMGNSEVGHLCIGAGRTIYQDFTRINQAILDKSFFKNTALMQAIDHAVQKNTAIHLAGLLSPGGVHSHEDHFKAVIDLAAARGAKKIYIHAFLDGRDTPPKSATASLNTITQYCAEKQCGEIISIIGRYYAMDRDQRWERTQAAWDLITNGQARYLAETPLAGLEAAYARNETDEFVSATSIRAKNSPPISLKKDDTFICMNFRSDRMRQLTAALTDPNFTGFAKKNTNPPIYCITLTQYDERFTLPVAFSTSYPQNILSEILSAHHVTQLRIAETEKYAHVTFFFNGGREQPFPGESRILIPSPKVPTYDLKPDMSAHELTDALVHSIKHRQHDVIICNFANPDMVGHTGNLPATIQAIETIDVCLNRIIHALQEVQGQALITADHGNAEMLLNPETAQPHTAHTRSPVPFIYVGQLAQMARETGTLADISPTLLYLLGLEKPSEMTGESLLKPHDIS